LTDDPDKTRCLFFSFSNLVSVLRTPFLFLHLLYNELLLAAKRKKGEGSWRLVEGERAKSRFSRDGGSWRRHLWGWSPVSVGDDFGLAKRWRWLVKKKEGLSSFGQKARGMTERGMREVVVMPLWQLLWPSEKGSFGWF
jgi:hypothetical protein